MSGQETVTVNSPEQLLATVARLLGFHPEDSLVIVGLRGGPTARADAGPIEELVEALTPALPLWNKGVMVVGYGAGESLIQPMAAWLTVSGVTVRGVLHAGSTLAAGSTGSAKLDAKPVHRSREEMEAAHSASVTDVKEAESLALAAYSAGAGALAWVFLDRARALGSTSVEMDTLAQRLTDAVDPKTVTP